MLKYIMFLSLLASCSNAVVENAEPIEVFPLFSDHAVLQREKPFDIWGTATPNENIDVSIDQQSFAGKVNENGKWKINITAQKQGGPHNISVKSGSENLQLVDIYFGDVWLCSGQSNMEWTVHNSANHAEEIATGNHPLIRHIKVPHLFADTPQDTISVGPWEAATQETVGNFTAVGYFFAKNVREHHDVPIGLLNSSWGGSRIETWMRDEIIDSETKGVMDRLKEQAKIENEVTKNKLQEIIGEFPEEDLGLQNGKAIWASNELDDSSWKNISLPGLWEGAGYPGLDGIVWFRKEITLSKEASKSGIKLHLGKIDDSDWTYVNGIEVGQTKSQYNADRVYSVPASLLKEGKNTVTIRVEDTGYGGGVYGAGDSLYWEAGDELQSLVGSWKVKVGKVVFSGASGGLPTHHTASLVYNSMIHPIINFPIKGVLWYQGESNAETKPEAIKYESQFKNLITDWRGLFNDPNLPFYFVQLASFGQNSENDIWPTLRASQTAALALTYTAQATAMDIGNPTNIHPKNKQEVGRRLALAARNMVYGEDDINYRGAKVTSVTANKEGALITFDHTAKWLQINKTHSSELVGFSILNVEGKTKNVSASLKSKNTVQVNFAKSDKAIEVQYAWKNSDMDANLESNELLPAVPFSEKIKK